MHMMFFVKHFSFLEYSQAYLDNTAGILKKLPKYLHYDKNFAEFLAGRLQIYHIYTGNTQTQF